MSLTTIQFETRDRQGNLLRYNKDDDEVTLGELVRQERFGAGSSDQKNMDAEMAANIATDARFDVSRAFHAMIPSDPPAGRFGLHGRQCGADRTQEDEVGRDEASVRHQ